LEALERADASGESVARVDTRLTLQHLLSMTTGFDFSERYFPGDDVTDMLYRKPAMWLSAPRRGHAYSPGEQFAYSSGDINTASMMWQQSLAGQPYAEWVREHFSAPLKLREVILEPDASWRSGGLELCLSDGKGLGTHGSAMARCVARPKRGD
jgi:CubicO group peptidase (beta-lactamase class C family)